MYPASLTPDRCWILIGGTIGLVAYEKINYLMLMMVDRDVHFHVIPRYAGERTHAGVSFPDAGWPAMPNLGAAVDLGPEGAAKLAEVLAREWPAA